LEAVNLEYLVICNSCGFMATDTAEYDKDTC